VFGHEHYAEDFEDLACAATPIHGPISGKMVGAVDLTRWRKDADALLIALAKTTADQITQARRPLAARRRSSRCRSTCGPAGIAAESCWRATVTW
jgi:transcriptional regulator of acetoin/glycerol metabolism